MKLTDKGKLLSVIEKDKLVYLMDYKIVKYNDPAIEYEIYSDSEEKSFLVLQHWSYGIFASVINFTPAFYGEVLEFLKQENLKGKCGIDLPAGQSLDQSLLPDGFGYYQTFVGKKTPPTGNTSLPIRKLTKKDKALVAAFEEEPERNKPTLKQLYAELEDENNNEIFAAFDDNGKITGYLSCSLEVENIWDVEYINVAPQHRNKGIGTELAAAYRNAKLEEGQIPFYSGVSNPASAKAALKAGFEACGQIWGFGV